MSDFRFTVKLSDIQPGTTRQGPHRMTERLLHWWYCAHCGLLGLKNEETRRALRGICRWEED